MAVVRLPRGPYPLEQGGLGFAVGPTTGACLPCLHLMKWQANQAHAATGAWPGQLSPQQDMSQWLYQLAAGSGATAYSAVT